jgi:hypothetical protein
MHPPLNPLHDGRPDQVSADGGGLRPGVEHRDSGPTVPMFTAVRALVDPTDSDDVKRVHALTGRDNSRADRLGQAA